MTKVYVHRIETAVPEFAPTQPEAGADMEAAIEDPRWRRIARHVYKKTGIEKRHLASGGIGEALAPRLFRKPEGGGTPNPSMAERNAMFAEDAKKLVVEASRRVLSGSSPFVPSDVTHVITVTSTGFYNPGPDYQIVTELGLAPSVERYQVGFMACYAAFPALRMAQQFCLANPAAVVLVVSVELCSLHMQLKNDASSILANSIFGDGCAAAIVSAREPSNGAAVYELGKFNSAFVTEGRDDIQWAIGDHGFDIVLSPRVPDLIGANIGALVDKTIGARDSVDRWAVHPGGRAILDNVQEALGLRDEQLAASRAALRDYGNMSSASILFVLKNLLEEPSDRYRSNICAVGFGPGLSVELAEMTRLPAYVRRSMRPPAFAGLDAE